MRWFERLMWGALLISIGFTLWQYRHLPFALFWLFLYQGFWLAFVMSLVWLTARRRKNWARWTLFVLFVLEQIYFILSVVTVLSLSNRYAPSLQKMLLGPAFIGHSIITVMELAAYVLIFTGNGRTWFRKGPASVEVAVFN